MLFLARGRFGVVRECRENATGKIFMAKIVPYSQENKQDVLKEYEILKSLRNEKVMALHEAYVTPRYLVLVAEYCTGKELLHSLTDRWEGSARLGGFTRRTGALQRFRTFFSFLLFFLLAKGSVTPRTTSRATWSRSSRGSSTSTTGASSTWTSSPTTSW